MSRSNFSIQEHVLPGSYIRGFAHPTQKDEPDVPVLHIKRYTPIRDRAPDPKDITIIACHANGLGKELYEPLWDELLMASRRHKTFGIRSIWIADAAHQGQSGVLNEAKLGNDPSWLDHPRDLFLMVNHFRKEMPRPLVGIGHSMGGNNIVNLSLMHPHLFSTLILLDPVIQRGVSRQGNLTPAYASTFRRDLWPSRGNAAASFKRNPMYQGWDPRVFDRLIEYGLRDLPTALYPEYPADARQMPAKGDTPVTLTTTKQQEVLTFVRSRHPKKGEALSARKLTRRSHPDMSEDEDTTSPFYNGAPSLTFKRLPNLHPSCFYMFAEKSVLSNSQAREDKMDQTGIGQYGSGGAADGRVKEIVFPGVGHFLTFEIPGKVADEIAKWTGGEMQRLIEEENEEKAEWDELKGAQRFTLSEDRLWWTAKDRDEWLPPKTTKL